MQNQLEKYLWKIEDQLVMLPGEQRREEVREIRSHLERMIEENIVRGCDADKAVKKALEQFGSARKVGQELRYSSSSTLRNSKRIMVKFIVFDAALILLNAILFFLLTINGIDPIESTLFHWVLRCSGLVVMFAFGWALKAAAPKETSTLFIVSGFVIAFVCTSFLVIVSKGQSVDYSSTSFEFAILAGIVTRWWQIKKQTATSN